MTTDRTDVPWDQPLGGGSHDSVSDRHEAAAPPPSASQPIPRAAVVGVGVASALALGLLVGLWAKPTLGVSEPAAPMQPVTAANAARMDVEVSAPAPLSPVPRAAGKLEVLPPGAAQAAAPPAPLPATPIAPQMANLEARGAPPAPAFASADPACAGAHSRAALMVCADPELAAADRELNQAYRRALRSGVPPGQLRDEQRYWLAIREEAARRSPSAVASVYEQRIDELNQIAEDGPG